MLHVVSTESRGCGGGGRGELAVADVGRLQVQHWATQHRVHGVWGCEGRETSANTRGVPSYPAGLSSVGQGESAQGGVSQTWRIPDCSSGMTSIGKGESAQRGVSQHLTSTWCPTGHILCKVSQHREMSANTWRIPGCLNGLSSPGHGESAQRGVQRGDECLAVQLACHLWARYVSQHMRNTWLFSWPIICWAMWVSTEKCHPTPDEYLAVHLACHLLGKVHQPTRDEYLAIQLAYYLFGKVSQHREVPFNTWLSIWPAIYWARYVSTERRAVL